METIYPHPHNSAPLGLSAIRPRITDSSVPELCSIFTETSLLASDLHLLLSLAHVQLISLAKLQMRFGRTFLREHAC